MLTRFDDYPVHQIPEPIAQPASSDRNTYDRYWFNGYTDDGTTYFGVGLGLYPNRRIMDAGFSVLVDGRQHAFHASRRAPREPSDTTVGPMRLEVTEPMRRTRIVLEPNETGMTCDLEFIARTACMEEGRQTTRRDGRVLMDATRFAQLGRWHGEIRVGGHRIAVDRAHALGTKDRSWGIRPVGEPEPGGAPSTELPQFFFLWGPTHWTRHCTHFGIFEDADGRPWHMDGMVIPAYDDPQDVPDGEDPGTVPIVEVQHRLDYEPGTRRARRAEVLLVERGGRRHELILEPLLCFRMKGLGYSHPTWAHGTWKGELAIGGESWATDDLDPLAFENLHIQQVMRVRRADGEVGIGVLEQFAIGPHAPSGFRDVFDGAPG
jgi:hypothetical protein